MVVAPHRWLNRKWVLGVVVGVGPTGLSMGTGARSFPSRVGPAVGTREPTRGSTSGPTPPKPRRLEAPARYGPPGRDATRLTRGASLASLASAPRA